MSQNRSSAVMAQRVEPHDSLDDFPTQPWATRALVEYVLADWDPTINESLCWEPACNRGYMARPLKEYFGGVCQTDIYDYQGGHDGTHDFLAPYLPSFIEDQCVDWIVTNPPFRLAQAFINRALEIAEIGVAVIVRTQFVHGIGRYNDLFSKRPPTIEARFAERVPMLRGRIDPKASTATDYTWLVWIEGEQQRPPMWIPPCRKQLERPEDYEGGSV